MNNLEIKKPAREYLPEELKITKWEDLESYFEEIKKRPINSVNELKKWMKDISELASVIEEERAWAYIRSSIDTKDEKAEKEYLFFVQEISPKEAPYWNEFNKKLIETKYVNELKEKKYEILLREIKKSIQLYREENIPIMTKLEEESQEYGNITGNMTVNIGDKELTMQQAGKLLKEQERPLRKEVFEKTLKRRKESREKLDELYDRLIKKRDEVAKNADHKNYRDYMFEALGRFDYGPKECFEFHEAIEESVMPTIKEFDEQRKEKLELKKLRPWDLAVDLTGKKPLKPFETAEELVKKTIKVFEKLDPYFGERIKIMKQMKYLDLESKKGKRPGGYNYPLHEIGVPFIFMNSVGAHHDMETMMHEGGHAIHSFLTRDLELVGFKDLPSEIAELASMSMELLSMEHWNEFYNPEDLKRAKIEQLKGTLETLPWVAAIDSFQHWIYENPKHTREMRTNKWLEIVKRFFSEIIDFEDYESAKEIMWQKQLHLFEVPFYYIEYAISQLGAIAIYKNYKENPKKAIEQYKEALRLGYTKTIPEIYETAGIKFNFTKEYVRDLVEFIRLEIKKIEEEIKEIE